MAEHHKTQQTQSGKPARQGNQRRPAPAPGAPGTQVSGVLVVDKPAGWTSHDVVGATRRLAGTRKVGHAGTLDPMATGVLVIGLNKATRLLTYITGTTKTYAATIRLGVATTTDDAEGEITATRFANAVTPQRVNEIIDSQLSGDIMQVPASVSALKIDGKRAHQLVREGQPVELAARPVSVTRFQVTDFRRLHDGTIVDVDVEVDCSAGTYIRSLARDLGEALGVGGHLTALRRTRVGPFSLDQALTLDALAQEFTFTELSVAAAQLFSVRELSAAEAMDLSHGRRLTPSHAPGHLAARDEHGTVVALIHNTEHRGEPVAAPVLVFDTERQAPNPQEGESHGS